MMKKALCLAVVVSVAALAPATASAASVCWQISPFIDTLRVDIRSSGNHWVVNGSEQASSVYFLQAVGSISHNGSTGLYEMTFHTGKDGFFGGGLGSCVWEASIDDSTLTGPISVRCDNFENSGNLVPISCSAATAESAAPGALMGE